MALPGGWVRRSRINAFDLRTHMTPRVHAAQDTAQEEVSVTSGQGDWLLTVNISTITGIVQVNLPFFARHNPIKGAKEARDSMLKLLAGKNRDINPLFFRSEKKMGTDEDDPYYKAAPGWTTLAGGTYPKHACTPTQICEWLADVVVCVPFIKRIQFSFLESDGRTVLCNLDDIRARNIPCPPVPRLHGKQSPSAAAAQATITALRSELDTKGKQMEALQRQVNEMKNMLQNANFPTTPSQSTAMDDERSNKRMRVD